MKPQEQGVDEEHIKRITLLHIATVRMVTLVPSFGINAGNLPSILRQFSKRTWDSNACRKYVNYQPYILQVLQKSH
jgi:hypothetical protein